MFAYLRSCAVRRWIPYAVRPVSLAISRCPSAVAAFEQGKSARTACGHGINLPLSSTSSSSSKMRSTISKSNRDLHVVGCSRGSFYNTQYPMLFWGTAACCRSRGTATLFTCFPQFWEYHNYSPESPGGASIFFVDNGIPAGQSQRYSRGDIVKEKEKNNSGTTCAGEIHGKSPRTTLIHTHPSRWSKHDLRKTI